MAPPSGDAYPYLCKATITPLPDRPGEFEVTIGNPPRRVVLGSSALALAQEFDGQRTCAEIASALIADGVPLPSPDFVLAMAQQLAQIGLVLLSHQPIERNVKVRGESGLFSTNPLRHRCLGCGRSCQGHIIGPLEPEFIERVPDILATLQPLYPELTDEVLVPMERDSGATAHRLAFGRARACVFLGDDGLCRIHKHIGPEAKPAMCRFFPIRLVQTEDGFRVGISRCYEAHKTYKEGLEQTIAEITGMQPDELLPPEVRGLSPSEPGILNDNPEPGSREARRQQLEHHFMAMLEDPQVTLGHLLHFACEVAQGQRLALPPTQLLEDPATTRIIARRLRSFGQRALATHAHYLDDTLPDGHIDRLGRLLDFITQYPDEGVTTLTPAQRDYSFHILREWFFLRDWFRHPSIEASAVTMALGVLTAAELAAGADEGDQGDLPGDLFAHALITWVRLVRAPDNVTDLFTDQEDFGLFLTDLGEAGASPEGATS
ncbi:MAG: hypothetical protein CMH57_00660 [Myxococcales bacterium]|nr:hypothetical protein [Myxococcales bacterium]